MLIHKYHQQEYNSFYKYIINYKFKSFSNCRIIDNLKNRKSYNLKKNPNILNIIFKLWIKSTLTNHIKIKIALRTCRITIIIERIDIWILAVIVTTGTWLIGWVFAGITWWITLYTIKIIIIITWSTICWTNSKIWVVIGVFTCIRTAHTFITTLILTG